MSAAKNSTSLILPTDSAEVRQQIEHLLAQGYKVRRPTAFQIKVGPFNYYPSKGKIYVDPAEKREERGFDAFLKLIEKSDGTVIPFDIGNFEGKYQKL